MAPAFTPGADLGQTDLLLSVARQRPWRVSAGYANFGGSPASQDRYFIGVTVGDLPIPDAVLAVQVTGSPDFWRWRGGPFGYAHPAYQTIAGQLAAPLGPRQDIEINAAAVESNQPVEVFVVRQQTLEADVTYRFALSNLAPLPGRLRVPLRIAPFAFLDAGYGRNYGARAVVDLASVGLGATYQLSNALAGNLTLCLPLASARDTAAGSLRLEARLTATY